MPEPFLKNRSQPSRRTKQPQAPTQRPAPSRFAAVFKLDDPGERRAFDWMEAFHEPGSERRLLDVTRARFPESRPDVIMLSEWKPDPGAERPAWAVIRFEIAEIRVTWQTFGMLSAARAAFSAAVAIPRAAVEVAHG
jgi:hypothetical protein